MFLANFNRESRKVEKMKTFNMGVFLLSVLSLVPVPAFAQGLDEASNVLDDFRLWAYGALAIFCLIYMLYRVTMAFIEKHSWGDVFQGLGYCAIAGGIMVAADFMWQVWGSGSAL